MFAHRIWTEKMCVLKVTFQVAESAVIACLVVILFNKKDNSSERGAVGLLLSSGAGSGYQSTAAGATCRPEIDICRRLGTRLTTYWPVFARLYHVYKKLSYRRWTARYVVSVETLPVATQQCRNYLYDDKS